MIAFKTRDYPSTAVKSFNSFRVSNYLCDVVIVSKDGQRFPAHRIILASASQFFRKMFRGSFLEGNQTDVPIGNVDGASTKMLLDHAYTGETECPASFEIVLSLYEASHYVQFDDLFEECSYWLKAHVDVSDCLSLAIVAERHGDSRLVQMCDRIAAVNISPLAEIEAFLSLSVEHLGRIMARDDLGVKSEDDVLIIFRNWIKHDEESRRSHVETLSQFVRFPLIDFQESSNVLSDLDLVSHYYSSDVSSSQRRFGCDGILLVAGGRMEDGIGVFEPYMSPLNAGYVISDDVDIYDANCHTWAQFPPLAVKTCNHKIATSYGVPYVLGGDTSCDFDFGDTDSETNIVQRYDAERRKWVVDDVKPMSCKRKGFEIVSCSNCIYGMSIKGWRETMCEVFDPEKRTWTPVSSPVDSFKNRYILCSLAERIFAIGFNHHGGALGSMKYDPFEDRWCEFKSCPLPTNLDMPDSGDSSLSSTLDPTSCVYVTVEDQLYINIRSTDSAAVFDGRNESFFVVDKFFPFTSIGLAYDHESKRMYCLGGEEDREIAVSDERISTWDRRRLKHLRSAPEHTLFDCAVLDRKLMLNFHYS